MCNMWLKLRRIFERINENKMKNYKLLIVDDDAAIIESITSIYTYLH